MKLIVGLGNPGKDYENTRHNIGFMIIDEYLKSNNCLWKEKFEGKYTEINVGGEKVIFLKPLTYMNLSGNSVRKIVDFYKISTDDILIVQDDLDLPFLKYRLKYRSSSGGHNGIKSIISCLNTDQIPRLKVGIANNKNMDTKDYVLGKFSKEDINDFNSNVNTYIKIIDLFVKENIESCMQVYNSK